MNQTRSPYRYGLGVREGFPIALGYLTVSFGFGIAASTKGLRIMEAVLISMTNLTSAGQVAGLDIIAAGGGLLEMALTQLVISLRYSLMGISLSQNMDDSCTVWKRLFLSCALTDEIFAVAVCKPQKVGPKYIMGLLTTPYIGWTVGTLLGIVSGQLLPENIRTATGIMIYGMFLAIIIPPMRDEKGILSAVALAIGLSCLFTYLPLFSFISSGFSVILCAIIASVVLALAAPIQTKEEEEHDKT